MCVSLALSLTTSIAKVFHRLSVNRVLPVIRLRDKAANMVG
jgi:hypothetical protein